MDFLRLVWKTGITALAIVFYQSGFSSNISPQFWVSAEYLYWWIQDSPISIPLITANNNPKSLGIITEPGTRILFGAGSDKTAFDFKGMNGARISAGVWVNPEYGLEASGFSLIKARQTFSASSVHTGIPIINIPFYSGQENVLVDGNPNTALISDTFRSFGFDINALKIMDKIWSLPITLFSGFRYLDIQEQFFVNDQSFPASGVVNVRDNFSTNNHFYGIQAGAKTHLEHTRFVLDISASLALGNNHQVLAISGATQFNGKVLQNFGLFSEPSNLGRHTHNTFAVLPELRIKASYAFSPYLKPFIAYDGLYINQVLRPGNAIDRNINTSQNPLIGGSGTLIGPAAPRAQFRNTGMWMQGLGAGIGFIW